MKTKFSKHEEAQFNRFLNRRNFLKQSAIIAGAAALPFGLGFSPKAQGATAPTTFTYYIHPSGNDSNPGTLAAPWAITSLMSTVPYGGATNPSGNGQSGSGPNVTNFNKINGKGVSVGLLPGTYNVSAYMKDDSVSGALQFPGGTSTTPNYIASSDANGNYSPRTATITGLSATGIYGGGVSTGAGVNNGPLISHSGEWPTAYTVGNLVIDGLNITGFSFKGIRIGGASAGDGPSITGPVTVQNCEFFGGGANVGDGLDNYAALWIDGCSAATATNNYFHDTYSWHYINQTGSAAQSMDHLNAIICWQCTGTVIQNNTCVNAANIYGKEIKNQGSLVQNNYVDTSMYSDSSGISDFTGANTSGLTMTTIIRNNVILATEIGIGRPTLSDSYGWSTPVQVYNNTIIGNVTAFWGDSISSTPGQVEWYNNILVAGTGGGFWPGSFLTNPSAPGIWDYNLFPASGLSWDIRPNGSLATEPSSSPTSAATFASALVAAGGISGAEANSHAGVPTFTSSGTLAAKYQLASGSLGKGTGRVGGTTSGEPTDMGAWGNGATQIGCTFAGGSTGTTSPTPNAPTLISVA